MSTPVITDFDHQAFVDPIGNTVIFSFEKSFAKDAGPKTARWCLTHAGRVGETIKHIGQTCALIEEGVIELDPAMNWTTEFYADRQLNAIKTPCLLAELPQTTTIVDPDFDSWPLQKHKYESKDAMREDFAKLLDAHGVREPNRTIRVDRNIDLLLALDRLDRNCHSAWPKDRALSGHSVVPFKDPLPGRSGYRDAKIIRIDAVPDLMLVTGSGAESPWINTEREIRKDYWFNTFPVTACHESWIDGFDSIRGMMASDERIPASSVVLRRLPDEERIGYTGKDWRGNDVWDKHLGPERDEITMQEIVDLFGDGPQVGMLARSSSVSVVPPKPDEDEDYGPR